MQWVLQGNSSKGSAMADLQLTPALEAHIAHYGESHCNPVNQAMHTAGIPLLMVSSLGLFARAAANTIGSPPTSAVAAGAGLLYARWDGKTAPVMAALFAACYAAGRRLPTRKLLTMFGVGAALHAVGHYRFEHRPPAFLSGPISVFEAPVWLLERRARDLLFP
jgi:uncharacterized membrane protein YGL010W